MSKVNVAYPVPYVENAFYLYGGSISWLCNEVYIGYVHDWILVI